MTLENRRLLRDAFGTFMTGVTVVTALDEAGAPIGFTANSFSSVSLDPPLLLVSIAKTSANYARFMAVKGFAINILSESQKDGQGQLNPPSAAETTGGHTIFPWLVVGGGVVVGVVGAVLYFGGKGDFPSECTLGVTDSCKTPGYTEEKRAAVLDAAKSADDRVTAGLPIMIAGGVLIAAGITWFFIEPPKKRKAPTPQAFIRPQIGWGYAGLSGAF